MALVTNIVELEKRVTALEAEMKVLRRDTLSLQSAAMEQMVELNRRVATFELTMKADLRALEEKFEGRMGKFESRMDRFEGRMDRFESELGQVKAEQAALRRDLPGIVSDALREVLSGSPHCQ
jgi:hypothetical protein